MNEHHGQNNGARLMDSSGLDALIAALVREGRRVVGPVIRDGAILLDEINGVEDLPRGVSDEQDAAFYRLRETGGNTLFGYNAGPQLWKKFLFPPRLTLWTAKRNGQGFEIEPDGGEPEKLALLGVRPCDLAAIRIQDRVFADGEFKDLSYATRRRNIFAIAVNCSRAGGTCFCASMGTGPKASGEFDIALTEIEDEVGHRFLLETGSAEGERVLENTSTTKASENDLIAAKAILEKTSRSMGRRLETEGLKEILYESAEGRIWEDAAERCLACANCTMVCPTCFCSTVEDMTDLSGDFTRRERRWDSCFTLDFSYIHGGPVRRTRAARYRHWITHKLASWMDQFGTAGCTGCGRCITWCPAAIDITKEARAARDAAAREKV
ncbi:MAG: 4Fe-4S dicluster domain-containing protein [Candidatus Nitrospinota bacterium M3_3B_026]